LEISSRDSEKLLKILGQSVCRSSIEKAPHEYESGVVTLDPTCSALWTIILINRY